MHEDKRIKGFDIPLDFLKECMEFCDGDCTKPLVWKQRPYTHFKRVQDAKTWNSRYKEQESEVIPLLKPILVFD